jgi:hypothetical protein
MSYVKFIYPFPVDVMQNFFTRFLRFYETSTVGTKTDAGDRSQRLARRWDAIVSPNLNLFKNATVLDLASHDGRWSMAALDAGARHVTGIEGRPDLVNKANEIFTACEIPKDRYDFVKTDVLTALPIFEPGRFDLILNLGFFYHTARHCDIFKQMYRLNPRAVILDSEIDLGSGAIVRYKYEDYNLESSSIPSTPGVSRALVGFPSQDLITLLCDFFGFKYRIIDWQKLGIIDWEGIDDYRTGPPPLPQRHGVLDELGPLYHWYRLFGVKNEQLPGFFGPNQLSKEPILCAYIQYAIAKCKKSIVERLWRTIKYEEVYLRARLQSPLDKSWGQRHKIITNDDERIKIRITIGRFTRQAPAHRRRLISALINRLPRCPCAAPQTL